MKRQLEVRGSGDDQPSMIESMCSDRNTVSKISGRRRHARVEDDQKKKGTKDQSSCGSSNNGGISRVCSDCNTTRTPLWRSGPLGPKSLCNACGIKQRKARKAMAAGAVLSCKLQPVVVDCGVPFKKRFITTTTAETAQRKLSFEDIAVSLNKRLMALNRAFSQDEKEAAILLMALSCGTVCSL